MPWINDVVPYTTILSTWGNNVRDHVTHVFASKAEMVAQAVPKDGMVCHCTDTRITYIRVSGAWWVLAMPWRPFTAKAWQADVNGNGRIGLGLSSSQSANWQQSMGRAHVIAQYVVTLPPATTPYDVILYVGTPINAGSVGPAGYARLVSASTAAAYGGGTTWSFHEGAYSGFMVVNVGQAVVPSNATIRNATTMFNVFVDIDLTIVCDPTVDTP